MQRLTRKRFVFSFYRPPTFLNFPSFQNINQGLIAHLLKLFTHFIFF